MNNTTYIIGSEDIFPRQKRLFDQYALFLLNEACEAHHAREKLWQRDFSSQDAYIKSVEPNRQHFLQTIGGWPWPRNDLQVRREKIVEFQSYTVERVFYAPFEQVKFDVLLLVPKGKGPFPALLIPGGVNAVPETVCGLTAISHSSSSSYHRMGARLAEHGYVILAPRMVTGFEEGFVRDPDHRATSLLTPEQREIRGVLLDCYGKEAAKEYLPGTRARGYLDRICRTIGRTLMGAESFALSRCIDLLQGLPEVDPARIGMYGVSQGGKCTMWLSALDTRIAVGVSCVFFNSRLEKQIIPSEGNSTFLLCCEEEHLYPLLREFADSDMGSLVCPRPFAVEAGLHDDSCRPDLVRKAFAEMRAFYDKLGIPERCQLFMHEGIHEIEPREQIADTAATKFLDKWLKK